MATQLSDQLAVRRANGGTAVATRNGGTIFDLIQNMRGQFETALPAQLKADKFVRVAMTTLRQNPKLLKCDQNSLLAALMLSAQLGLEPGSPLGHAYLVPYGNELTFIVGYKGYIDLARRSGRVASIYAEPVYEGDEFRVSKGLNRNIIHEPAWKDGAPLTHVYAVAKYLDGSDPDFVVLKRAQIDAYRKRSKASGAGPWVTDYEAMSLKTAVRRLSTWLPMSTEQARAVAADETVIRPGMTAEAFDDVRPEEPIDGNSEEVRPEASGPADPETGEVTPNSELPLNEPKP